MLIDPFMTGSWRKCVCGLSKPSFDTCWSNRAQACSLSKLQNARRDAPCGGSVRIRVFLVSSLFRLGVSLCQSLRNCSQIQLYLDLHPKCKRSTQLSNKKRSPSEPLSLCLFLFSSLTALALATFFALLLHDESPTLFQASTTVLNYERREDAACPAFAMIAKLPV